MNIVVIRGHLSGAPVLRTLASGAVLLSLELATTTACGGAASVPVAWFDPPRVPEWADGDELVVSGIVKRRFYRAASSTQSRTEVVATEVVEARKRKQVDRLIARSLGELSGGVIET